MHENAAYPRVEDGRTPEENDVSYYEQRIDALLERLQSQGLDTRRWNEEYLEVPDELEALQGFHSRILQFMEQREDALLSFDFAKEYSEDEKEKIRKFDREVRASFRDPEAFLGNGATAEVYSMTRNDNICIKFIINQERYNENNHLRKEFHFLSKIYEHTKDDEVTTPYPAFLRIHANEGHSYGMERIQGGSLSQILEQPTKYEDLIRVILEVNREKAKRDLQSFVKRMHEAGMTHGDLYQRNIMFDDRGRLYVIDFGKAQQIDFEGQREEERNLDVYIADQSLRDFFQGLDLLTDSSK